jgi:hypothetical protein
VDTGSPISQPPSTLVSDAERDGVAERLRDHTVAGRLTLEEFSQRLDQALGARTHEELVVAERDLPASATTRAESRRSPTRWSLSIMGGTRHRGRWLARDRLRAVAVMGSCHLDFREAAIEGPELVVDVLSVMGGVHVQVPEGVTVTVSTLSIMGGKRVDLGTQSPQPGMPTIHLRGFNIMGGLRVSAKPVLSPRHIGD